MAHFRASEDFVKRDYMIIRVILFLSLFTGKIHKIYLICTYLSAEKAEHPIFITKFQFADEPKEKGYLDVL